MSRAAVVVDTNIVFKALRLRNSAIRDTLADQRYHFYAPKFLIVEIFKHKEKLLKNNAQAEDDLYEYLNSLLQRITFVNEDTISIGSYLEAYIVCAKMLMRKTCLLLRWPLNSLAHSGRVINLLLMDWLVEDSSLFLTLLPKYLQQAKELNDFLDR